MNRVSLVIAVLVVAWLSQSCVSQRKMRYMDSERNDTISEYAKDSVQQYRLQVGDKISIKVVSTVAGNADIIKEMFDEQFGGNTTANGVNNPTLGYIIDTEGNINIPMVGFVKVQGLTLQQTDSVLAVKMKEYINYIYVKTALLSFRISVLGEVNSPGTFSVSLTSINLYQAVGLAGDFTEYSNKEKVKLVRKTPEGYKTYQLNLHSQKIINSPLFELQPNDVLYVEPLKAKAVRVNSPVLQWVLAVTSIALLLYSLK